jgi:hypothetical protein
MLRQIQNQERFDVADFSGTPAANKSASKSSASSSAAPATQAKQ